jgi:hypothetical protein
VWGEKKARARGNGTAHGKAVPAWIEFVSSPDGPAYRVREGAGEAVRMIFRLCAEGLGTLAVTKRLTALNVPPIARGRRWLRSYVAKILDNRAVLGEYQPMSGHRRRRKDGEPIPNYFPAVVGEADWHAAHRAIAARDKRAGRPGRKGTFMHVFAGMLTDALDRCPLHVRARKGRRYLVSADATQGVPGSHWRPFPVEPFVAAVLGQLRELRSSDLFADPDGTKLADLTNRLARVERRLAAALARFNDDPESATWQAQVTQCDREKREIVRELAEARQDAANPLSADWEEAVNLMAQDDPVRLRQALLSAVESFYCLCVPRGHKHLVAAQVFFRSESGAGQHRDYLILIRPGGWTVRSFAADSLAVDLDLRNPDHVARLEKILLAADLESEPL